MKKYNYLDYNIPGIAQITTRKSINIDDKEIIYHEIIQVHQCYLTKFTDDTIKFVSLREDSIGVTLNTAFDNEARNNMLNFKTIQDLAKENNGVLEIKKFLKEYRTHIGECYRYNRLEDSLTKITDKYILSKIKESNNKKKEDFSEKKLNSNSDISVIYKKVKETIISQDEQIMKILTTLFKNQAAIKSNMSTDLISKLKENLLIYGPTGTGKTEILKRIADVYKVPIVIEDATSLTESGYIGRDVSNMLENLYLAADKDLKLAENGILVIDEFDKLAENRTTQSHVSRSGVQRSLLKLLDGTMFYLKDYTFNTSKLSIVCLGTFADMIQNNNYNNLETKDFVEYGIMRELIGRFSKKVVMNTLTKDDLKKILIHSNLSPINTYKNLFDNLNINFKYDESFLDYIAYKASLLNTGARSLKTVFDEEISGALFRIFSGEFDELYMTRQNSNDKSYILKKKI